MRRTLTIILMLCLATLGQAQEDSVSVRRTTHSTLYGIGRVNHLDTYLSPLEYTGPQVSFLHESLRLMKRPNLTFQTITQGQLSYSENDPASANEIGGGISYDAGIHYNWQDVLFRGLRLMAGGQAGADAGFLYNTRNGNNPAQARLSAELSASVAAIYKFHLRHYPIALRYQADLPVLGMAFSPNYGQSYYELFSQGHYDHNIRCTHPGNALSLRQMFTIDLPIRSATIRLGYLSDIRQAKLNGLKQHQYSRSFMIGYVKHLSIHKKDRRKEGFVL